MSFPPGTEMFQFPGFASYTYVFSARSPCGGVSPFGHPRINDRSHLPAAFRSVPRPSSPPGAKASTERSFHAREFTAAARTQDQTAPTRVAPARPDPSLIQDSNSTLLASANYTHNERNPRAAIRITPDNSRQINVHQIQIHRLKEQARTQPKGRARKLSREVGTIRMAPHPGSQLSQKHHLQTALRGSAAQVAQHRLRRISAAQRLKWRLAGSNR